MKYRLTEKIGSGGMAEVFNATGEGPEGFERSFVVKRILPRLSDAPEFVRMFVDEAKISARLIHPNIVQVFEFAYQNGGYYIVMEAVDGVDMGRLLRKLERSGRMAPAPFVTELGRQACRGLHFAHALASAEGKPFAIVHRDVTPPNIMVAWNGTVKIVDFGIARAVQELRVSQTDAGMVKGKMSYVAPEQLLGQPADARSDVFSLGIVLYELLVGKRLFVGENDLETLKLVRDMPIEPPSARNPDVKPALDKVIMRALARNPEQRYQSAGEMGDDLEDLVLRKRYTIRAFAEKTRELFAAGDSKGGARDSASDLPKVGAPADTAREKVAQGLGGESVIELEDVSTRRSPIPPPPPPPAAMAAHARSSLGPRQLWIAAAVPTLATLALLLFGVRSPSPSASRVPAAPATAAVPAVVQVSLDSVPQGATVSEVPPAGGGEGRTLGQTPLVLRLPRGEAPVEVSLSKEGYAPLAFKVIPNQDKTTVASLDRPVPMAVLTEAAARGRAGAARPRALASLAAMGAAPPEPEIPTKTTVRFRSDVGAAFKLIEARFVVDGQEMPVVTTLPPSRSTVVYAGQVRPGRHVVSSRLVYQGATGPAAGTKLNIGSDEELNVIEKRPAMVTIAAKKTKGKDLPPDKLLSVVVRNNSPAAGAPVAPRPVLQR